MQFAKPALELEFSGLHPETKQLVLDLDAWGLTAGLPEVVVTCVLRTKDEQEKIYSPFARNALRKQMEDLTLNSTETTALLAVREHMTKDGISERAAVARWARSRFSWHLVACAVDLRNRHYTAEQRKQVMAWLRTNRGQPQWEILEHDVGRGDHIHIGRRDPSWRNTFPSP